jgi:hypothetical protein
MRFTATELADIRAAFRRHIAAARRRLSASGTETAALTRVRRVDGGTLYAIRRTNRSPACNSR